MEDDSNGAVSCSYERVLKASNNIHCAELIVSEDTLLTALREYASRLPGTHPQLLEQMQDSCEVLLMFRKDDGRVHVVVQGPNCMKHYAGQVLCRWDLDDPRYTQNND